METDEQVLERLDEEVNRVMEPPSFPLWLLFKLIWKAIKGEHPHTVELSSPYRIS